VSAADAPSQQQPKVQKREKVSWTTRLREEPSARAAFVCLIGMTVVSTAVRAALVTRVHAPTVFSDELGYTKLAQSIGKTGHLALFDDRGLSYSPLYSVVLSPIYALGASAPTAYALAKFLNAFLISLSVFPIFKIARFVLPRRLSLVVAGLAAVAPLMSYPSFTISESLAYPLCLVGFWATLEAVRRPSPSTDALFLVAAFVATTARLQLIVLVPAGVTAMFFAALLRQDTGEGLIGRVKRSAVEHWLLLGVVCAGLLIAGAGAVAGHDVLSAFGRYDVVGRNGLPNLGHFLSILIRHVAGVDLAVGVVPFVGSLVAAFAFVRSGRRPEQIAFAAVALAASAWFVVEVAFDAAIFDSPTADVPRIHERFLIYLVPLFLVGLFAAFRIPAGRASTRLYWLAAAVAALLPATIPFHTVVNNTVSIDTFSLQPFAHVVHGELKAIPGAPLAAVWLAATLGLLYIQVRDRFRAVVILVLIPFIAIWSFSRSRIEDGSNFGRSVLPAHVDWIDRAHPVGPVVLVTARHPATAELETSYTNLSISRLYYLCDRAFGSDFGELPAKISKSGRLRGPTGFIKAPYVVGQASLRLRGRIVARNPEGHEVLVAPLEDRISVSPGKRRTLRCHKAPLKRQRGIAGG
jgi:hypothetical protein